MSWKLKSLQMALFGNVSRYRRLGTGNISDRSVEFLQAEYALANDLESFDHMTRVEFARGCVEQKIHLWQTSKKCLDIRFFTRRRAIQAYYGFQESYYDLLFT